MCQLHFNEPNPVTALRQTQSKHFKKSFMRNLVEIVLEFLAFVGCMLAFIWLSCAFGGGQ